MHQPNDAGRPGHVSFHVLHSRGWLNGDAASVEANAFADERDRRRALFSAVPAHYDNAAVLPRALPDAEQRSHAELLHRLDIKNIDSHAKLAQLGGAPRKFDRK